MSINKNSEDTHRERKHYYLRYRKSRCARKRYLSKYRIFGFQLCRTEDTRTLDIWLGSYLHIFKLGWYWD